MDWYKVVFVLAVIVLLLIVAYRTYSRYKVATGTPWQRWMAVFRYSGTILWARLVAFFGALTGLAMSFGDWLGVPSIQSALHDAIPPAAAPWYMVAIAVITEWLRRTPVPANVPPVNVPLAPIPNPPSAGPGTPVVVTPAVVTGTTQ